MSHALSSLDAFAAITETMLQAAEAQEWDKLLQLGNERDRLVGTLPDNLARHLLPNEHAQARELLEKCRHVDAQTLAIVGERQGELRVLLREPALA